MPSYRFFQLDVFTRTPLTGNPLAVFPEADGLTPATMQALAREMNLSETTFVLPSATATQRVRFFTPAAEIPLAGHPTIGTWWLLAELGRLDLAPTGGTITQETGRGVLPVEVTMADRLPDRVVMTQASPEFTAAVEDRDRLGVAIGGDADTLTDGLPAQVVSTALPQLMVPVRSLASLRALPSGGAGGALAALLREVGSDCAMCWTPETADPTADVHCRMFAPGLGVPEDPATGSAAGALGAYLVRHGVTQPVNGVARITVEQGLEIGRASRIDVEVTVDDGGAIAAVRVGGQAVRVIGGEVAL